MHIKPEYLEIQSDEELDRLKDRFKKRLHFGTPGKKKRNPEVKK